MKLQGKAYLEEVGICGSVRVVIGTDLSRPYVASEIIWEAENPKAHALCRALNAWRESYAQDCIDQTISLMEEIND